MNKIRIKDRDLEKRPHVLREKGIVPGAIYGPMVENKPIKIKYNDLTKLLRRKGEVYRVNSDKKEMYVKFGEIQKDPVTKEIVHFSLVQMPKDMNSEIDVPIGLEGTPIGVKKGGTLVVLKSEVKIQGRPSKIPDKLVANVSNLDIGEKVTVNDLRIPSRVETTENDSSIVAICHPPVRPAVKRSDNPIVLSPNASKNGTLNTSIAAV